MSQSNKLFDRGYDKFLEFVNSYGLIPKDRKQVVVAYSGGKDASLLLDFLCEYKARERDDIGIELITAQFPGFLYKSSDPARKKKVDDAVEYWVARGLKYSKIDPGPDLPDSVLDVENPCFKCALEIKPALLGGQISKAKYKGSVFCIGLTLDDAIGWFLEALIVAAGQGGWEDIKREKEELYAVLMARMVRATCKLNLRKNDLIYSRPLMNFVDEEIVEIVEARELPLIPEDCAKAMNRDEFVDSPRREFSVAQKAMRIKYPPDSPIGEAASFFDYKRASAWFASSGLMPPLEVREAFLNSTLG